MSAAAASPFADHVPAWTPGFASRAQSGPRNFPGLRAAVVAGPALRAALEHEMEIIVPSAVGWERELAEAPPQLLLVEAGLDSAPAVMETGGETWLHRLIAHCRGRGIPAVLWNTQDTSWGERFRPAAAQFDFVFCADPREAEVLRRGGVDAELLAPAFQPRIHHPFRDFEQVRALDTGVLYDGIVDLFSSHPDVGVLRNARRHGLRIMDSRSQVFRSKLLELGELQEAVLGCVDRQAAVQALRYARAALFLGASLRTRTTQHWSVLEAAACRLPVIHFGRLEPDDPRRGLVTEIADARDLDAELARIAGDDLYRKRQGQLAWRTAHLAHTFGHRVQTLCAKVGIAARWNEYPGATAVTPTRRLEFLSRCLDTFDRQRWPAKDLVLVVNRDSTLDAEPILRAARARSDVQVAVVPEEYYAGACMNTGNVLARGEYCFRMDDDDHYGEHYLMDMMLHLRSIDADVLGKPPKYCHIEAENLTIERQFRAPELTLLPPERCAYTLLWLGGNTLGGRRSSLLELRYTDRVFGAADTAFLVNAGLRGARIASLDDLNVVAVRRGDDAQHTWSVSVDALKKNSRELGPGFAQMMV